MKSIAKSLLKSNPSPKIHTILDALASGGLFFYPEWYTMLDIKKNSRTGCGAFNKV